MPNAERRFTVVDGGTGPERQQTYIDTGLYNEHGERVVRNGARSSGDGGDGGVTSIFKLDVKRDVQLAKWGVVGLGGAMLAMLWFLLSQIDNRFDRADGKVTTISDKVSDLRVEIAGQRGDIKAILDKLDDKPQGSSGAGQASTVARE